MKISIASTSRMFWRMLYKPQALRWVNVFNTLGQEFLGYLESMINFLRKCFLYILPSTWYCVIVKTVVIYLVVCEWHLIMASICPNTDGIGCFIQWECFLTICILSSHTCEQLPILIVLFETRALCMISCMLLYPWETLNLSPRNSFFIMDIIPSLD